jgi:nitrogenase molybdenum-iron protein alpha/beta subunit
VTVNIRFVHELDYASVARLGAARLNILRDPALIPVGEHLQDRFGTPFVPSFPSGFSGTLSFLEEVAAVCNRDSSTAIAEECRAQEALLLEFSDLAGTTIALEPPLFDHGGIEISREVAERLRMQVTENESGIRVPVNPATGTGGIRRMLHRWRCALRA